METTAQYLVRTVRLIDRATKRLSIALFALSGQVMADNANLPLNSEFKEDILNYCLDKREGERRLCINDLANQYLTVKSTSNSGRHSDTISLCSRYGQGKKHPLVVTTICINDVIENKSVTEYDEVSAFPYLKSAMRPSWVSRCAKKGVGKLNNCLQKEEAFYQIFWGQYGSAKKRTQQMDQCLLTLNPGWHFDRVNRCNNREQ